MGNSRAMGSMNQPTIMAMTASSVMPRDLTFDSWSLPILENRAS